MKGHSEEAEFVRTVGWERRGFHHELNGGGGASVRMASPE